MAKKRKNPKEKKTTYRDKVQFKHMVFKLEYKYNPIYAYNKEFGLHAFGSTINEMLKDI